MVTLYDLSLHSKNLLLKIFGNATLCKQQDSHQASCLCV